MIHHELTVTTQSHHYPIVIGEDLRKTFDFSPFVSVKQVLIVTNEKVAPLYLSGLMSLLQQQIPNANILTCILPDGEQYKNQDSITQIYNALLQAHFSRDCTLIALGGGVIGDMTGFAAATYMRGVDFIQIPTTLLSQVDSSVGGKTGINHLLGKNMIGAFWQPRLVVADMNTLDTLPKRELSAGMAEVIKYALIGDRAFLDWLERHMDALMAGDRVLLSHAVLTCCQHKANVVAEDEFETGKRALLNFGHTFGHIIETHAGYGTWLHGEAVAVGMLQAAKLSEYLGWLTAEQVTRIRALLQKAQLPIIPPPIDLETALALMQHDKKVRAGQIRLILLKDLGEAVITADYPTSLLNTVLTQSVI